MASARRDRWPSGRAELMPAQKVTAYLTEMPLETIVNPICEVQSYIINMRTMVGLMSDWGEVIERAIERGNYGEAKSLASNSYRIGWIAMEELTRIHDTLEAGEDKMRQHTELRALAA